MKKTGKITIIIIFIYAAAQITWAFSASRIELKKIDLHHGEISVVAKNDVSIPDFIPIVGTLTLGLVKSIKVEMRYKDQMFVEQIDRIDDFPWDYLSIDEAEKTITLLGPRQNRIIFQK